MKYPDEHWEKIAKMYSETPVHPTELTGSKTYDTVIISKIQNHYPDTTEQTVANWVKICRKKGLL